MKVAREAVPLSKKAGIDPYRETLRDRRPWLEVFSRPRNVVVIGATEKAGSVGRTLFVNLTATSFGGAVYPVNLKHATVLGAKAYPAIKDLPEPPDLAVICTPAPTVPEVVGQCAEAGARGAVVISAGFRETGQAGAKLEEEIKARAAGRLRIIGPNCLGVMRPPSGLNATFAQGMARSGRVAFLSQRGALCTAVLDWSLKENVGFSAFVSTGSMLDVGWGDLIDSLAGDPRTDSIVIYMESVGDARSFMSAAREAALSKPIMVLTNAGGPGVLAADALIGHGGSLAALSPWVEKALDNFLPSAWSRANPIDVLGDADPARYTEAIRWTARDAGADGLLAILTPQAMTDPTGTAEALAAANLEGKPLLASWMGGEAVDPARKVLNRAGIPVFGYPDTAARVFSYMWKHGDNLRALYETPSLSAGGEEGVDAVAAGELVAAVRRSGRTLLTEWESKRFLAAYGIPVTDTRPAVDEDGAVRAAWAAGFPVAVKLNSITLTHKSDVGGVWLNVIDEKGVRNAFWAIRESVGPADFAGVTVQPMVRWDGIDLILGLTTDLQFGPVMLFGSEGRLVEVYKDRALALPPLNTTLARRLMEKTKVFGALKGARGTAPVDLDALAALLVRFSRLAVEQRRIKEIDVNPLLASAGFFIALDARVVLHGPDVSDEACPRAAVRPYPSQYVWPSNLRDGTSVTLRPIRPEDEPLMVDFHKTLSDRSVYPRYLHSWKLKQRVTHERLSRICFTDYDRELALVAERGKRILAVGRLSRSRGENAAERSLIVADPWQHRGLGTELMRRLLEVAGWERLSRVTAEILPENNDMRRLCEEEGFQIALRDGMVRAEIKLGGKS